MEKILFLVLKELPFRATLSGEKKIEYRRQSEWIKSRLVDKNYDYDELRIKSIDNLSKVGIKIEYLELLLIEQKKL